MLQASASACNWRRSYGAAHETTACTRLEIAAFPSAGSLSESTSPDVPRSDAMWPPLPKPQAAKRVASML